MALAGYVRILHIRKPTGGSSKPEAMNLQGNRSMKGRACTLKEGRHFHLSIAVSGHENLVLLTNFLQIFYS